MTKILSLGSAIVLVLFGTIFGLAGLTTIEPGEVGVVIKQYGEGQGMQDYTFDTGMHWVNPVQFDVVVYDTRLVQERLLDIPSNTKDGQPILVDVTFEIGLIDSGVPTLHENVGSNYFDQVIYPAARAAVRNNTSEKLSDEVYTGEGRVSIQDDLTTELVAKLEPMGIRITTNLSDIEFQNADFVATLERKAKAAQEQVIQTRLAEAAAAEAIKVQNTAEGERFRVEQEAEAAAYKVVQEGTAERERLRLLGEGQRLQEEERALGILAVATAEAEGRRLMNEALQGPGGELIRDIEVLGGLGANVEFYGVPTGAPGTNNYIIDEALQGGIAIGPGSN